MTKHLDETVAPIFGVDPSDLTEPIARRVVPIATFGGREHIACQRSRAAIEARAVQQCATEVVSA